MAAAGRKGVPIGAIVTMVLLWFVWGTTWPAMRMVFLEMPVWQFRGAACLIAGVALLAMGYVQNPRRWKVPRALWPRLVIAALLNMTCWHILVSFGLQIIGAGHAAIVCYTLPVWTALFSGLFFGERITGRVLLALVLGLAGVAVLFFAGMDQVKGAPLGFALVFASAITWAAGTLVIKHYAWPASMTALAGWQLLIGLVPIAFFAALSGPFVLHQASLEGMLAGLYTLLIGMIAGYALWFRVVEILPATVASIGALMIPVIGVVSAAIVLGEPVGWQELLAMVLVFSAIALVLFVKSNPQDGTADATDGATAKE